MSTIRLANFAFDWSPLTRIMRRVGLSSKLVNKPTAGGQWPPHVIFVNRFFWPDESATSQMLSDLAWHVDEQGFRVTVIAGQNGLTKAERLPKKEFRQGVEIHRVWTASIGGRTTAGKSLQFLTFYVTAFFRLLRIAEPGSTIVVKTDPPLFSVVAAVAARLRRARLVNWLQDLYPEVAGELGTPMARGVVGRFLQRMRNLALRQASMNVAIGHLMAKRVASEGVDRSKIVVIPNWADEVALAAADDAARSAVRVAWGIAPETFVVGYSGNLGRAHEAQTMLETAVALENRSDIKFVIVGGGFEYERFQREALDRGLRNILFLPPQPRSQLDSVFAAFDAQWLSLRPELEGLVVPSKFYGILASGKPVIMIGSRSGELAGVVAAFRNGFVVETGDAASLQEQIVTLAEDREIAKAMGNRSRLASESVYPIGSALVRWSGLLTSLTLVSGK